MSSSVRACSVLPARRKPLEACVIALFALPAVSAWAAPPAVSNCNDSGAGSLRYAVDPANGAVSGDTIDMSALACSTITLTSGAIAVTQKDLTLIGPGKKALSIEQTTPDRVIVHTYGGSAGHLYIQDLRVGFAYISSSGIVHGGCIASLSGALTLKHVGVYYCSATTTGLSTDVPTPNALGGAVFAATGLTVSGSTILHGQANATHGGVRAQGGCAMTFGPFDMKDSAVAYCAAQGAGGRVRGGALELKDNVVITGSVIGKSTSTFLAGGVDIVNGTPAALSATISNSTITSNSSGYLVGGLYANSGHVAINNSTIAFNSAAQSTYTYNASTFNAAPGVSISSSGGSFSLQSTIIANNSANGTQEDLSFGASTGLAVAASNNLVRAYRSDVTLPAGQGNLSGICPLLAPIRDNGGVTPTHALQSGSPAIDAGNDTANDPHTGLPAAYDQRGAGPVAPLYERISGTSADIGAYEYQKTDIVFDAEFETGCE